MELGLVSTIAGGMSFEELIDFAEETGLECAECGACMESKTKPSRTAWSGGYQRDVFPGYDGIRRLF